MALSCLTNVCGDIHIVIPTVVMFEMLPATILTFHVISVSVCFW